MNTWHGEGTLAFKNANCLTLQAPLARSRSRKKRLLARHVSPSICVYISEYPNRKGFRKILYWGLFIKSCRKSSNFDKDGQNNQAHHMKTQVHWIVSDYTPWSRVLPEKLTRPHLVKKFSEFYGLRKFITASKRARHLSLSWTRSTQSMPPSHVLKKKLILSSYLCLGPPSIFLPCGFPTKTPYAPQLFSPYSLHAPPIIVFLIWTPE
jgi:hypothetical protein